MKRTLKYVLSFSIALGLILSGSVAYPALAKVNPSPRQVVKIQRHDTKRLRQIANPSKQRGKHIVVVSVALPQVTRARLLHTNHQVKIPQRTKLRMLDWRTKHGSVINVLNGRYSGTVIKGRATKRINRALVDKYFGHHASKQHIVRLQCLNKKHRSKTRSLRTKKHKSSLAKLKQRAKHAKNPAKQHHHPNKLAAVIGGIIVLVAIGFLWFIIPNKVSRKATRYRNSPQGRWRH